jgi:hypothetical protein
MTGATRQGTNQIPQGAGRGLLDLGGEVDRRGGEFREGFTPEEQAREAMLCQ